MCQPTDIIDPTNSKQKDVLNDTSGETNEIKEGKSPLRKLGKKILEKKFSLNSATIK